MTVYVLTALQVLLGLALGVAIPAALYLLIERITRP